MSLRLVNIHGFLSLPLIFVMNIAVTAAAVMLVHINEVVAGLLLFGYSFYLLLQTKLMMFFVAVGLVGGLIVSGYSPEISQGLVLHAIGFLAVSSIVAHTLAFGFTTVTGI
jgi:hypothetical protein